MKQFTEADLRQLLADTYDQAQAHQRQIIEMQHEDATVENVIHYSIEARAATIKQGMDKS